MVLFERCARVFEQSKGLFEREEDFTTEDAEGAENLADVRRIFRGDTTYFSGKAIAPWRI